MYVSEKENPARAFRGCVMDVSTAKREIERAVAIALSQATSSERELVEEVKRKLEENRFNLVVLGQFKRGKTTFVNALLGKRLLPSAVLPLTSIVTAIEYGEKERAEVIFHSGEVKEIPIEDIRLYVTEKENPANEKGVKYVRVFYPGSLLEKGIILVDTPGVGSLYDNNTDVTYDFLPRVDAAVFLLTVDPPLSKEEAAFLKDIFPHVERIFFVLNKVDYIAQDELLDVLSFVRENLERLLGKEGLSIYPISARMALEGRINGDEELVKRSGILRLEGELEDFLLREKAQVVLRSSVNKLLSVLSTQLFRAELELKTALTPLGELESRILEFENLKKEIEQEARDSEFLFKGEIESLVKLVNMDVERFQKQNVSRIFKRLMEIFEENRHKPPTELSRILDEAMKRLLVEELDRFVSSENEKINEEYGRIARRFSDKINAIIDRLMELAADIFEVSLERFSVEREITSESSLWYKLDDPPRLLDIAEGVGKFISYSFLPSAVVHRKIKSELSKKLPEKVDMNCGRIRADFVDRINRSAVELRWGMREKLKETISFVEEAVKRALELKKKSEEEIEAYTSKISALKRELEEAVNSLKEIASS